MYSSIAFFGLGLIGGSIAKTIKKKHPDIRLYATASHSTTIEMAYADGIIENNTLLSPEELAKADIVFFCCPVKVNAAYLKEIKPYLREDTLLTDVGSVKGDIQKVVESEGLLSHFIGGHPMAGSESIGYENSNDHLLENAYYILTDNPEITEDKVQVFSDFVTSLGAVTMTMTAEEHDFATAAISHLPHVISAALVNMVQENDHNDVLKTIAAGGFKDITRISSSSPVMWQHICLTNRDEILNLITIFEENLKQFKDGIAGASEDDLLNLFSSAKDYRDSLPVRAKGLLPAHYTVSIDIEDEVGGIAMIATLLAFNNVSIKNIGIVHNREFEQGALQIEFYENDAMQKAIEVLKERNYTVYLPK